MAPAVVYEAALAVLRFNLGGRAGAGFHLFERVQRGYRYAGPRGRGGDCVASECRCYWKSPKWRQPSSTPELALP
jgi:hypothetical protein